MKKDGVRMVSVIMLILVLVTLASFGQIYIKKGLNNIGGIGLKELLSKKILSLLEKNILIGFTLYVFATMLWFVVLSRADLSYAYPMIALGYVVTAFLAKMYFNENITIIRWFGILLILSGVFFISRS